MKPVNKEDEMTQVAMGIILEAATASTEIFKAFECATKMQFNEAHSHLVSAENHIVLAHRAQTELIQKEVSGEDYELSLLFIHAQDTLMTIKSEKLMTERLIKTIELLK